MDAFVWNEHFETGIESIDRQHRQLVETTNHLAAQNKNLAQAGFDLEG